jgi:hypothetical protein
MYRIKKQKKKDGTITLYSPFLLALPAYIVKKIFTRFIANIISTN